MKKLCSIIVMLSMVMSSFIVYSAENVSIESSGKCGTDMEYKLYSDGRLIINATGENGVMSDFEWQRTGSALEGTLKMWVSGPWYNNYRSKISSIEMMNDETAGYKCTTIGTYNFAYFDNLTSVVIPDTIENIGANAFYQDNNLSEITLPESIKTIGKFAFLSCSNLKNITIPSNVTSIGKGAFEYSGIEEMAIPESVTEMEEYIFYGCENLKQVILPKEINSIGESTFGKCTSLKKVFIPANVTSIGKDAFSECTALTDIYYGGTKEQFEQITKESGNDLLSNAKMHYSATGIGFSVDIQYSTTELTNQDVTVNLVPSEEMTEDTVLTHTFTSNGCWGFILKNDAGDIWVKNVEVTWIDKTPPTGKITYSSKIPTYESVTATLESTSEEIQPIEEISHTFTENGEYTFKFKDLAGNEGSATAIVYWIDKSLAPTPIPSPTLNPTPSPTPVITVVPTETPTVSPSAIPTVSPTPTETPIPTPSMSPQPQPITTVVPTLKPTEIPTHTPISTETPKPTETPTITQIPSPIATVIPNPTNSPSPTESIKPSTEPIKIIEPIGDYIGKLKIEEKMTDDNLIWTVTSLNGQSLEGIKLFISKYENGSLSELKVGESELSNNILKITFDLQSDDNTKIMLWDKNFIPIVNAITVQ